MRFWPFKKKTPKPTPPYNEGKFQSAAAKKMLVRAKEKAARELEAKTAK